MAKIFLDPNEIYGGTIGSNSEVIGNTGSEAVTLAPGATGVVIDSQVEKEILAGTTSDYNYLQVGNHLKIYSGNTLVSDTLLSATAPTKMQFANGTVDVVYVAGSETAPPAIKLGGATVTAGTPASTPAEAAPVTPAEIVTTDVGQTYTLTSDKDTVIEGTNVTFTVTRTGDLTAAATLTYNTTGDTNGGTVSAAVPGTDTTPASGNVTFAAGSATATFTVSANADSATEGLEGLKVSLFNGTTVVGTKTVLVNDDPNVQQGQTFTLTAGLNTVAGGSGNDTIDGGSTVDTWTAFDNIDGGAGTDTMNVLTTGTAAPGGITLKNVETLKVNTSGAGYTIDTTGYTGLTGLTLVDATNGNVSVTSSNTTAVTATGATGNMTVAGGLSQTTVNAGGAVTLSGSVGAVSSTVSALAANAVSVNGGTSVNVTATGATTATITVGNTSAPTGTVTVAKTISGAGNVTGGAISLKGGTTVSSTTTATNSDLTGTAVTQGDVTVTGTATTTSVTVNQSATVATAANTTESAIVDFANGTTHAKNSTIVIGGITATVLKDVGLTGDAIAAYFASLANGATPTTDADISFTGALSGWTTGALANTDQITFTSTTANSNVTDLANTGTAVLTGVTITQGVAGVGGVTAGAVSITDVNSASTTAAGVITSASLNNFGAATVNSGALATLTLAGKGTSVAETAGALTTATATTLALNLNGVTTTGAVTLDADHTTLNIAAASASSTLNSLSASGATTVNISGDKAVTFSGHTLTATTVINSTNSAGVTFTGALAAGVDFNGGAGADTITLSASGTKAIDMGAGDDTVTYAGVMGAGGSVEAGTGTDTIKMTSAQAATALGSTAFAATVSNFEVLQLTDITGGALGANMANADGINSLTTLGASAGTLAVTNAAEAFTLTQTAANTAAQSIALLTDSGTSDSVNLVFKATNGFTNGANATTIANVETINITTDDTDTTAATTAFTSIITAAAVKSVSVSGDAGFNASTGLSATTLTSFDASGVTATGAGGAVTLTTGDLAAAATLKGGAGTNTIDASAVSTSKVMTITGGAGLDNLIGGAGDDVISGGNGGTTGTGLVGNAGADTITGGTGTDTITGGTGADTLTGGTGVDTFIYSTIGDSNRLNLDTITDLAVGTGGDTITLKDTGTEVGVAGGVLTATATNVSLAGTFLEALDIASAGDGTAGGGNGIVTWFQYAGNTYLVEDRSASTTNDIATDVVIKITGLVDLLADTNLAITFA